MYTDLEGILSACLYLHVSFYSGVIFVDMYFHTLRLSKGGNPQLKSAIPQLLRTTELIAELWTKNSYGTAIAALQNWTSAIPQLSVIDDIFSLSLCLSVRISVCLSAYLSVCLPICLSVCLSVCLSAYLYVCLSVCLSAIAAILAVAAILAIAVILAIAAILAISGLIEKPQLSCTTLLEKVVLHYSYSKLRTAPVLAKFKYTERNHPKEY
jgi:hypothetical protein